MKNEKLKIRKNLLHNASIVAVVFLLSVLFSTKTFAIGTYFSGPINAIAPDSSFTVDLLIRDITEPINAISATVAYNTDTLTLLSIREADSPLTFFTEPPKDTNGAISFSGIAPGGFLGTVDSLTNTTADSRIISFDFKALKEGEATLSLTDLKIYANDGLGTQIPVSLGSFAISIKNGAQSVVQTVQDTIAPHTFIPVITQLPNLYNGKYVLLFNTTDGETGIDHYEVREGRGNWAIATSPYVLENQSLLKKISVKAIDRSGNIQEVTINTSLYTAGFGALIALIIALFLLYYTRKHHYARLHAYITKK